MIISRLVSCLLILSSVVLCTVISTCRWLLNRRRNCSSFQVPSKGPRYGGLGFTTPVYVKDIIPDIDTFPSTSGRFVGSVDNSFFSPYLTPSSSLAGPLPEPIYPVGLPHHLGNVSLSQAKFKSTAVRGCNETSLPVLRVSRDGTVYLPSQSLYWLTT
ncbi:hypothetical protein AAG570_006345 [Ranatra chinensis]|uniref:Uncharacterized protein n=1 Tax=Ranatra chinensis TaxID=642074 RepID=A0ABD0YTT1_9HEMI